MSIADRLMTPATLDDIVAARKIVDQYLRPTPVLRMPGLDAALGFSAVLKCENLQPLGAFKARGGVYFMSQLTDEEREGGVVTASSGNHGQSIAYAAALFGVPAVVFMPEQANPVKRAAIERMGADVIEIPWDGESVEREPRRYAEEHDMFFIHGIDNAVLHAGVGSYALELIEEAPDLDAVFVPLGGGSGVCATATVFKAMRPQTRIIGVQARNKPAVYESFHRKRLMTVRGETTHAEGLATDWAYELPFGVMQELVDDVVLVDEEDLRQAMLLLIEQAHIVAEPSGAAAFAAARNQAAELAGKQVGIIISGGNVSHETLRNAYNADQWR
jgi:threonine dehydratase